MEMSEVHVSEGASSRADEMLSFKLQKGVTASQQCG